jgi:hypothetical protein
MPFAYPSRSCSSCLPALLFVSLAPACADDDGDASASVESDGASAADDDDDSSGGDATTLADTGGNGELGPTAQVRIVNLVEGVTFTVWGADTNFDPVIVHDDLAFETVSDYFDAPLNEFTMHPELVLAPMGEAVESVPTWQVDHGMGPDRMFIIFTELDAANERATIIVQLDEFTGNLEGEQLDETELMLGDTSMANLHIGWRLSDLAPIVPTFAIAGDPCLFHGSTGVPQPWSVAPGTFEVGIYDRQTVDECTETLASTSITAAAGEQVLLTVYDVAGDVRFLTAPIPQ